ncbi:hypothetical protein [Aquimarina sediminis]|uniref:hypothetical protein n=1 Tax=Aquimarina sediminis TaxID=2070536 RepID=UPI000CA01B12|nr:hypothetical protein [Aquimarina sediminis]
MNYSKIKKVSSILFIVFGAMALMSEIYAVDKNYYVQSVGLIFLMLGVFLINTKVTSKARVNSDQNFEEEE